MAESTPYLTADLPGVGGRVRETLEDFVVEELPLYPASGVGEHVYVTIQKAGISTHEAARRIGRALRISERSIGFAGLKDARAIARQRLSIQGRRPEDLRDLDLPGIQVLAVERHSNKLRIGHLAGNRFLVRLRGVSPGAELRARRILEVLADRGVPNSFGPQRFGAGGVTDLVGRAIVKGNAEEAVRIVLEGGGADADPRVAEARRRYGTGDLSGALAVLPPSYQAERSLLQGLNRGMAPDQALRRVPKRIFRLYVSAYQSRLFNRLLAQRMPDLGKLEAGDLAYLTEKGAVFLVEEPTKEQPRADRLEISPSGPLYGGKVLLAGGEPGRRERRLLADEGVEAGDFRLPGTRFDGERRPYRVPLKDPGVRSEGDDAILLSFALPKGAFATVVLREVRKEAV